MSSKLMRLIRSTPIIEHEPEKYSIELDPADLAAPKPEPVEQVFTILSQSLDYHYREESRLQRELDILVERLRQTQTVIAALKSSRDYLKEDPAISPVKSAAE